MSSENSLGSQIRAGIKGIHGVGEAIRGTALSEVDKAFGTSNTPEAVKNEAIARKGIADAKAADQNIGQHHGIQSSDATSTHVVNKSVAGPTTATTVTRTSAGTHSTAPGNIGIEQREPVAGNVVQEALGTSQRF